LGPVLILALVGGIWLDEFVSGQAMPGGLSSLLSGLGFDDGRSGVDGARLWPPGLVVLVAMLALAVLGGRELSRILIQNGIEASRRVLVTASVLGLLVCGLAPESWSGPRGGALVASAAVLSLLISLVFHSRHRTVEGAVASAGGTLLAFVYLGMMFGFLLVLRREHSAWVLLWVLATTKSCDIGAYFTGRAIGRRKLIPWLSPGKTWEGLWGGMVFASGVGAFGFWLLDWTGVGAPGTLLAGALIGGVLALVGQAGDLIASLFKRDAGLKDSGRSLPGFGGVLDVLDSVLLAAPAAYWMLRVV